MKRPSARPIYPLVVGRLVELHGCAAPHRNLSQRPVYHESNELAVRRPERTVTTFSTRDVIGFACIEAVNPQLCVRLRGSTNVVYDLLPVGRNHWERVRGETCEYKV